MYSKQHILSDWGLVLMAPILGILASSNYQRVTPDNGAMFPIAMVNVGSAGAANIDFTSLGTYSSTYKHLQIRGIYRQSDSDNAPYMNMTFNNDTGSNYASHALTGTGSSATAQAYTSSPAMYVQTVASDFYGTGTYGALVIDILDAFSTSKYKTVRSLVGVDNNGSGYVRLNSGLWQNTNAITSIKFTPSGGSIKQYTQIGLFGIKG